MPSPNPPCESSRKRTVAITGASGFIGTALQAALGTREDIIRLVRRSPGPGERQWDPAGRLDPAVLSDVDVVIHLAGENIAGGRWSAARQAAIRESRIAGTKTIVAGIASARPRPRLLISASAVGYYGDRGETTVDESHGAGVGFLPGVAVAWERATDSLSQVGVRVVNARLGMVLSPHGGALAEMLLPFRLGLGARLGSGRQWMSWIDLDDAVAAVEHVIDSDLSGPVNVVAPNPVSNAEFTEALGRVLRRPTLLAVPELALRLLFGGLADEGLLASTRVVPTRLVGDGFQFRYPEIERALRHQLSSGGDR
jgi:uncharacterized protein (TIGR01777 family)